MSKISEFLTHFDDQHLANLQCAAEDGRLTYKDTCNCLVHHFAGDYSATKWQGEFAQLAREAEGEFLYLGGEFDKALVNGLIPLTWSDQTDPRRRAAILPLIHAEWGRRASEKMAKQVNEIEELTLVSPNLR